MLEQLPRDRQKGARNTGRGHVIEGCSKQGHQRSAPIVKGPSNLADRKAEIEQSHENAPGRNRSCEVPSMRLALWLNRVRSKRIRNPFPHLLRPTCTESSRTISCLAASQRLERVPPSAAPKHSGNHSRDHAPKRHLADSRRYTALLRSLSRCVRITLDLLCAGFPNNSLDHSCPTLSPPPLTVASRIPRID